MKAYCYASGQIEFGDAKIPNGALPMATGPDKEVRDLIEATARHGYKTHLIDGRPTKIPGTENLLVPGIPEAQDQVEALDALHAYLDWIRDHAPKSVRVF